jgi:hypothetical protein
MCEKCIEIDVRIERYRNILGTMGDQATVDAAKQLIADLKDQKSALHPQRDE